MKLAIRLTLLLIAFFTFPTAQGQDDLFLSGAIKDFDTKKALENCTVTIFKNGKKQTSLVTGLKGKYELHLDLDSDYDLKFSKAKLEEIEMRLNERK